jgi:ADP-heptose:LPS heptosyltransferase
LRRLLIRPGGIGDCITCLPVLEWLRTNYTEVWVPRSVVPLVQFADRVRAIADTGLDLLGIIESPPPALQQTIAAFDHIVSWYGTQRPEFRRVAVELSPNWEFLPALPPAESIMHATDFHALNASAPLGLQPHICVESQGFRRAVAIHPFSGGRNKNWSLDCYRQLAQRLPCSVEWIAGPDEDLDHAVRFENLLELASWMRSHALYIGNDSGITHLAAAIGMPTIALFGPSNHIVWRPRGPFVRVIAERSMDEITVDAVLGAATQALNTAGCL